MELFTIILKLLVPVFLAVGVLHLWLGARADVLLGAKLPSEALSDPALDSQNRFYGVAYGCYGILLYVCATDLARYAVIFNCVLLATFAGGLARLVSIMTHGRPPPLILALLASELLAPPILAGWVYILQQGN
jgi:hypothetical protein